MSQSQADAWPDIRRVVTRHDSAGKASVWIDGAASNHKFPADKLRSTLIWVTDQNPDLLAATDDGQRIMGTAPPAGGTRCGVLDIAPGNALHGQHRTDTIDYCVCLAGELEMLLDNETVHLKAGDILVQRGTNHAWLNRGDKPARLLFVLVDAEPKRAESVGGQAQAR
jgi:quercetin dioxygenase-like cupin family protein